MLRYKKVLIACAAVAALASGAVGQQMTDRHVRIWRPADVEGGTMLTEEDRLEFPPVPATDFDSVSLTQGADKAASPAKLPAKNGDSPFADEMQPTAMQAAPCSQCSQCGGDSFDCGCGCTPFWAHRTSVFADLLYLRASGVGMAYALQQNSPDEGPQVPFGAVGVLDPAANVGYRVGGNYAFNDCASLGLAYTNFHSHTTGSLSSPDTEGGSVGSLVLIPGTPSFNSTASQVTGEYDINFQFVDVNYRRLVAANARGAINYNLGVRYAALRQFFQQNGDFSVDTQTNTNIRFDGFGLRTGFDGERQIGSAGLSFYGNSFISVLFGQFRSDLTQQDTTNSIVQATSSWNDRRVVPILEYEIGLRWTSSNLRWRLSAGYYTAFWFNTITTPQYVQAVQTSNFVHLGETITFDGLVTRLEYCF